MSKNLYVIRLDDKVLTSPKFSKKNPAYQAGKPCMYVGITSHSPRKRFKQHKEGYKSSRWVKTYGKYLMWKKFQQLNPVPAKEAEEQEKALAERLRQKGYGVWSN